MTIVAGKGGKGGNYVVLKVGVLLANKIELDGSEDRVEEALMELLDFMRDDWKRHGIVDVRREGLEMLDNLEDES